MVVEADADEHVVVEGDVVVEADDADVVVESDVVAEADVVEHGYIVEHGDMVEHGDGEVAVPMEVVHMEKLIFSAVVRVSSPMSHTLMRNLS